MSKFKRIFCPIVINKHWVLLVMEIDMRMWKIYDSGHQLHEGDDWASLC